jgi:hypothetical protein
VIVRLLVIVSMSPAEMVNVAVFASFWNGPLAAAVIFKSAVPWPLVTGSEI